MNKAQYQEKAAELLKSNGFDANQLATDNPQMFGEFGLNSYSKEYRAIVAQYKPLVYQELETGDRHENKVVNSAILDEIVWQLKKAGGLK